VFFGAVKATVTNATASQLTVTVPAGASFQPISVTNTATSLAAFSAQPFYVTYLGKSTIATADFDPVTTLTETSTAPGTQQILTSDIDGDGLADMIVVSNYATTSKYYVNVFKNKGNATGYANVY
jgi:hypothetical protein